MTDELPDGVPERHPVVLFDGVCNLCEGSVKFLIQRDPEGVFRFAPLQSTVAEELLASHDIDPTDLDSVVLVEGEEVYTKSDAVLRAAHHLGGIYRLLPPFEILPRSLRNRLYDFVADRRYGWFGKKEQCMMPTPDIRSRFLAGGPGSTSGD
ncbi:thiol-disulfide oxidoreductase DCC family protein [Halobacteriaceae archaeon SHR40]|uniref:thiol-disulfide oxidoreductase DCC family protein n=1 Tax=Halovenus amylolytica TaxID=2500550 RepID=UPI000FE3E3C1